MAFQISRGVVPKPQKVVIYGPEGVGKTTLAAHFPKPLFVDTEDGSGALDVARLPRPTTWQMLVDEVTWVRDFPAKCGGTLVIDTADWAERLCTAHVCKANDWGSIETPGYGKGYTYVKEEFGRLLALLDQCVAAGLNVLVTAHAQIVKFEQPDETGAYDRWEMKLSRKQVAPLVKEWADAVLFADYKTVVITKSDRSGNVTKAKAQGGRNRVLHTAHAAAWDAKNRWGLPDEVPMEWAQLAPHIPVPELGEPTPIGAEPPTDMPRDEPTPAKADLTGLRDLMTADLVSEAQLREAMAEKGYVTADTPLENYGADLVGWIESVWPQIRDYVRSKAGAWSFEDASDDKTED